MAPPSGNICGSIICSRKLSVLDAAELPGNRCQQGHYQKNQGNITLFNYKYNQNEGGRSSTAFCLSEHPWAEVRSEDRSVQRISANKYDPKGVVRITSGLEGRSHKEQVKAPDIGPGQNYRKAYGYYLKIIQRLSKRIRVSIVSVTCKTPHTAGIPYRAETRLAITSTTPPANGQPCHLKPALQ